MPNTARPGLERWVLLDGPIPSDHIPSLMGSVVSYLRRPLRDYFPEYKSPHSIDKDAIVTTNLVPNLFGTPIEITDLNSIKQSTKEGHARANVSSTLDAHATARAENFVQYEANQVVRYDMGNPQKKIERLWENAQYRDGVLALFKPKNGQSTKPLAMVTGILSCKRMSLVRTSNQSWGGWLSAHVPLVESLGDYLSIFGDYNPGVSAGASKKTAKGVEVHLDEEVIFALAYDSVYLERIINDHNKGPKKYLHKHECRDGDTAKDFNIMIGDQVIGDIYFGSNTNKTAGQDDEEEDEGNGEEERSELEAASASSQELRRTAFQSGIAVIDTEFDNFLPPAYPNTVDIAGDIESRGVAVE